MFTLLEREKIKDALWAVKRLHGSRLHGVGEVSRAKSLRFIQDDLLLLKKWIQVQKNGCQEAESSVAVSPKVMPSSTVIFTNSGQTITGVSGLQWVKLPSPVMTRDMP